MVQRRNIRDFLLVLIISMVVFFVCISNHDMGFWEPWETSTLLVAQRMAQSNIVESSFWVPQLGTTFVAQPLLQLFSLVALLHFFPEPDAFLLRLPGCILGVLTVILSFLAVRLSCTRRAAWITACVLLTLPMFVLGGKLIHGDIWLIFAVSLPGLLYWMACYATTRRMHRTMLVFSGLSVGISFLAGGFFAIAILALEGLLYFLLMLHHPNRNDVFTPLGHRYFAYSLLFGFAFIALIFGIYVTEARYALQMRTPMTMVQINEALDEDRIVDIALRNNQVIGNVRVSSGEEGMQKPFVLVQSQGNLSTNATRIFQSNETERRTFENLMMWRFQKKMPARISAPLPPMDGAFSLALRFFWNHTNAAAGSLKMPLVRAENDVLVSDNLNQSMENGAESGLPEYSQNVEKNGEFIAQKGGFILRKNEIARVLNDDVRGAWLEIQDGDYRRGFVPRESVRHIDNAIRIHWTSWIDVIIFALFPWSCFIPIALLSIVVAPNKLAIARSPFIGEFTAASDLKKDAPSPVQRLLLSWLIVGILALFVGINQNYHSFFTGIVPVAALFGIALSSQHFWQFIRKSLEARLAFMAFAIGILAFVLYSLYAEPFRIVRYLLTDPYMHWEKTSAFPHAYIVFICLFIALMLISFTSLAENIQTRAANWHERHQSHTIDSRSNSSATLMRVSRDAPPPMPYAPALSLILLASIASGYIYTTYLPGISDNFTESQLIERYFALAKNAEPVYLLSGENSQFCVTYRDCDPGYTCLENRCHISTFASYSLNVAKEASHSDMMAMLHNPKFPAFFIIPKDALFDINQSCRLNSPNGARENVTVVDAPSSRLHLITNQHTLPSANPFDKIFMLSLPTTASKMSIQLDNSLRVEGFAIDKLDFEHDKTLRLTLYYRITHELPSRKKLRFSFEIAAQKFEFQRELLNGMFDSARLLPGDLIADTMAFDFPLMQRHGILNIQLSSNDAFKSLTTIEY